MLVSKICAGLFAAASVYFFSPRLLKPEGCARGTEAARELRQNLRCIERSTDAIRRRFEGQSAVPPACEWLLDNRYLARREALSALAELRRARHLRACGDNPNAVTEGMWLSI